MNEIVENYLNINYEITVDDRISISFIYGDDVNNKDKFLAQITLMFGDIGYRIANRWLTLRIEKMFGDLHDYYRDSYIKLTRTGWDFYHRNDVKINIDLVKEIFNGKYSDRFIEKFNGDTRYDLIIKKSESMMGKMF